MMTRRSRSTDCGQVRVSISRYAQINEVKQERQVINVFLDCPGCGQLREFVQAHPDPERCPDVPSGCCPEWFCSACGSSLLLDLAA